MTRDQNPAVVRKGLRTLVLPVMLAAWIAPDVVWAIGPEQETYADAEVARLTTLLEEEIREPEALLHVSKLGRLLDEATVLPTLSQVLARAATDRRAHPEVQAYARLQVARTEWRRGRLPMARQWMDGLGMLSEVWFAGPFDNDGGAGFDTVWPPEEAWLAGRPPDPSAEFDGKDGVVSWRALPDVFPLGYVDLSALVEPSREVVVYLRAAFDSRRAKEGAVRFGAPGAAKVWFNGEEVFSSRADHPARFDQHAVGLQLREGRNSLLIKLSHRQGDLGYYLRLTDPAGLPLRAVRSVSPDGVEVQRPAGGSPPETETVLGDLVEVCEENPDDAVALGSLARVLALRHPFDRTEREHLEAARKAVEAASSNPDSSDASRKLADLHHLVASYEVDFNRRRLSLEAAIEEYSGHVPSKLDLGLYWRGRGKTRKALPYLRGVVEGAPGHVYAALTLADAEAEVGFSEDRRRRVAALVADHPLAPDVIAREAAIEKGGGRPERAAERLRVGVGLYPADRGLRGALTSVVLDLGRLKEAVEVMEEGLRFEPFDVRGRLRLADLLSANGETVEAERFYAEAAELAPDNADVHLRRALHHLRQGDVYVAREHLEIAFERRPQDPRIGNLRLLLEEEGEDFSAPFLDDGRALAEVAENEEFADEDVVALAQNTVVKVHRSGLSTRVHQEVHKVFTQRGADRMRSRSVRYTPGDQVLRIQQARVIRPDGSVLSARTERERSLSEPWARLYFDRRARQLSFPEVNPGDVVELVWRREDVSADNMFGDYFGDIAYFQSSSPIARRSYVLLAPAEREFFYNDIELPDVRHEEQLLDDGIRVLSWTAADLEKIVSEPGMPGWAEVAAFLHVSTYETWQEVAAWWWRLIEEQIRPSSSLVTVAHDLVEDIPEEDVAGRVAAIHNYVVTRTRYVGLEFGIHGYKPYRVDQVHDRRFGDCKDKASLMHALLGAVGIDSRMVILRMRRHGRVPDFPASLAVFNHAILYVPELDLWLDGTARFAGTGELPRQDQDAAVLVVDHQDPESSAFGYAPVSGPDENTSVTRLMVDLEEDGTASAEGTFELKGTAAPSYRRAFRAEEDRLRLYEQSWARTHPGVKVTRLEMDGLDELEEPVRAGFDLFLPRFGRREGERLSLRPVGEGRGYGERYAPLASRRHDLVLDYPFTSVHEVRVLPPEGWMVAYLPEGLAFESPYGRFSAAYEIRGGVISVEIEVVLSAFRIASDEYPEFREFLGRVDRAIAREVRLVRTPEEEDR